MNKEYNTQYKREWRKNYPIREMLARARERARDKGIEFNLVEQDILMPCYCPILGHRLEIGNYNNAPSLDRIDPNLPYVRGNVQVISSRANRIKSDANIEELRMVAQWMENVEKMKKDP